MRKVFSAVLVFFFHGVLMAQIPLAFRHITSSQGLSQNHGVCILQDHEGYMWFGTSDGLNKYDGNKIIIYRNVAGDSNSISNSYIKFIFEDQSQNLWIGTAEGLNLYDRNTDRFVRFLHNKDNSNSISDNEVNSICEDKSGNLWIGTNNGLNCLDKNRKSFLHFFREDGSNSLRDNFISTLCFDGDNKLLVATSTALHAATYDLKNPSSVKFSFQKKFPSITIMCHDALNDLWIGTWGNGIFKIDAARKDTAHYSTTTVNAIPGNVVLQLYCDSKNRMWAGIENGGLLLYVPEKDQFITYQNKEDDPQSLSNNSVSAIYMDRSETFWVGVHRGGINYYNPEFKNFTTLRKESLKGLSSNSIKAFCEDREGNIWIGTDGGGLNYWNKKNNAVKTYRHKDNDAGSIGSDFVLSVCEDREGNIWAGTYGGGLCMLNRRTERFTNYKNIPGNENSLSDDKIWTVLEDNAGNIWAGSFTSGLNKLDKRKKSVTRYQVEQGKGLTDNIIIYLFEDSRKNLWVGTVKGGLCVFDPHLQTFKSFKYNASDSTSISDNAVSAVTEDSLGNLWVATSRGLNYFDVSKGTFMRIGHGQGLPNEVVRGLALDDNGKVWLSTIDGISMYDPIKKTCRNFFEEDGLQHSEFTQNAFLKTRSGEIYFGGINGFNVFHPERITVNTYKPPVKLTDFLIFNKPASFGDDAPINVNISEAKEIRLNYDQSVITFGFTALNFIQPQKNKFAWKLEGFDRSWNYMGSQKQATYTNLDPGEYYFKVKASNNDGVWNEEGTQIKLIIEPPFWRTWWFQLLAVIFIAALVVIIFYLRVAAIRKQKQILKAEVRKRTQELSEANTSLWERNEQVLQQNERLEEYYEETLRKTEKILQQQQIMETQNLEMSKTVDQLFVLNQTKDKFFSILAHDLRNPVLAMNELIDSLKNNFQNLPKETIHDYVIQLSRSTTSVYTLLQNLLDWARTQSNKMECNPEKIFIQEIILKTQTLLKQQLSKKNLNFSVVSDQMHTIYADRNMVETILRNLISNAIKFTPSGGCISISTTPAGNNLEISVEDTGVGMSPEQLENLFRIDKPSFTKGTQGEQGSGLGLIVTKEFVTMNRGTIMAGSRQEGGTRFVLTFPVNSTSAEITSAETRDESSHGLSAEKLARIKGKRILIVEDDVNVRAYLRLVLSAIVEIFECGNGADGLVMAKTHQPSIIITDVKMPRMNGFEFCEAVKNDEATSHIPVVMMTGERSEESQLSGYASGADAYLLKPFKSSVLFEMIHNFVLHQERIIKKISESGEVIPDDLDVSPLDKALLEKVAAYIEENIADADLNSKKICHAIGVGRTFLYAKFKSLTGQGVHEFIKEVRLKKSVQLLRGRMYTVSQIAYDVGFKSPSYFIYCFSRKFGMPPKEFLSHAQKKGGE